jgi:hypothetical protein
MIYEHILWTGEAIAGLATAALIYAEWRPYEEMSTAETKEEVIKASRKMIKWASAGFIGYGITIALLIVAAYGMAGKK